MSTGKWKDDLFLSKTEATPAKGKKRLETAPLPLFPTARLAPKFSHVCRDIIGSLNVEFLEAKDLPRTHKGSKPNSVIRVVHADLDTDVATRIPCEWQSSGVDSDCHPKWFKSSESQAPKYRMHSWIYKVPMVLGVTLYHKKSKSTHDNGGSKDKVKQGKGGGSSDEEGAYNSPSLLFPFRFSAIPSVRISYDELSAEADERDKLYEYLGEFDLTIASTNNLQKEEWVSLKTSTSNAAISSPSIKIRYSAEFLKNFADDDLEARVPYGTFLDPYIMKRGTFEGKPLKDLDFGVGKNALFGVEIGGPLNDMVVAHMVHRERWCVPQKVMWKNRTLLWRFYAYTSSNGGGAKSELEVARRSLRASSLFVELLDVLAVHGFRFGYDWMMTKVAHWHRPGAMVPVPEHVLIEAHSHCADFPALINVQGQFRTLSELGHFTAFASPGELLDEDEGHLAFFLSPNFEHLDNSKAVSSLSRKSLENIFQNFLLVTVSQLNAMKFSVIGGVQGYTVLVKNQDADLIAPMSRKANVYPSSSSSVSPLFTPKEEEQLAKLDQSPVNLSLQEISGAESGEVVDGLPPSSLLDSNGQRVVKLKFLLVDPNQVRCSITRLPPDNSSLTLLLP